MGHRQMSARDALHLAIMEHYGIERILSFDAGFDGFPESNASREQLGCRYPVNARHGALLMSPSCGCKFSLRIVKTCL